MEKCGGRVVGGGIWGKGECLKQKLEKENYLRVFFNFILYAISYASLPHPSHHPCSFPFSHILPSISNKKKMKTKNGMVTKLGLNLCLICNRSD